MSADGLPLRVTAEDEEYMRIQYSFCPQSVEENTVSRVISCDPEQPSVGYVTHRLNNGETARFRGNWKQKSENMRDCILLFSNDEVVCVPLSAALLHLRKE